MKAAADAAFRNQNFVMNFKRDGVSMPSESATGFTNVDFQNTESPYSRVFRRSSQRRKYASLAARSAASRSAMRA